MYNCEEVPESVPRKGSRIGHHWLMVNTVKPRQNCSVLQEQIYQRDRLDMDSDSDYDGDVPDSNPPTPIEAGSFDLLTQRVEEFQRMHQLETIERLTMENNTMQNAIVQYQKLWCSTLELLEQALEALKSLQGAFENCVNEDVEAEKDWLRFWGIKRENPGQKYSPAGWI
jgi:hypothetical protein